MKIKKYFIFVTLIFLFILAYNKIPYNSFSLYKEGIDELNGTISIKLEGFLKNKTKDILQVDQGVALYYIEDDGLCLYSSTYLKPDNYTKNQISIKGFKHGNIKYLDSSCEQNSNKKYENIDNNEYFKI